MIRIALLGPGRIGTLHENSIDAALIATTAETHCVYIETAVAAGKPALCEKPIDLNLKRSNDCATKIADTSVPIQTRFNRQLDQEPVAARNPAMAPHEYAEAFMAETDGFIDCIENGTQPTARLEHRRQAVNLAEAAYLSLRTGRIAELKEVESHFV